MNECDVKSIQGQVWLVRYQASPDSRATSSSATVSSQVYRVRVTIVRCVSVRYQVGRALARHNTAPPELRAHSPDDATCNDDLTPFLLPSLLFHHGRSLWAELVRPDHHETNPDDVVVDVDPRQPHPLLLPPSATNTLPARLWAQHAAVGPAVCRGSHWLPAPNLEACAGQLQQPRQLWRREIWRESDPPRAPRPARSRAAQQGGTEAQAGAGTVWRWPVLRLPRPEPLGHPWDCVARDSIPSGESVGPAGRKTKRLGRRLVRRLQFQHEGG